MVDVIVHERSKTFLKKDQLTCAVNMLTAYLAERGVTEGEISFLAIGAEPGSTEYKGVYPKSIRKNGVLVKIQVGEGGKKLVVVSMRNLMDDKELLEVLKSDPIEQVTPAGSEPVVKTEEEQKEAPPVLQVVGPEVEKKEVSKTGSDENLLTKRPFLNCMANTEAVVAVLTLLKEAEEAVANSVIWDWVRAAYDRPDINNHSAGTFIRQCNDPEFGFLDQGDGSKSSHKISAKGLEFIKNNTQKESNMPESNNGVHTPTVEVTDPHPELTDEEIIEIFRARFNTTELENKLVAADSNVDAAKGMWEEAIAERDRIAEQLEAAKAARAKLLENL